MKRVLVVLVVVLGVGALGSWAAVSSYRADSAETERVTAAAYEEAHEVAYDRTYDNAHQKSYDEAYAAAAETSREQAYEKAYDAEYEKAYRANYIASYAKEAMEFQCEGTIPDAEADAACKSSAYGQAERAYANLGR